MDSSPSVVIWRIRRDHHQFICIVEQVGEESFELRVLRGHDVVLSQYFDEPEALLVRAAELRAEVGRRNPTVRRTNDQVWAR